MTISLSEAQKWLVSAVWAEYLKKTPSKLRLIDVYLAFCVLVGA